MLRPLRLRCTNLRGAALLNNFQLNKGTVFSPAEGRVLRLEAMLHWEVLPQVQTAATACYLANPGICPIISS